MKNRKAFTLVEVIVILVVLSILAAVAVPVAFRIFQVTAEDTTREEMDNIKKATIGDPRKLQSSFRSDFGFLGDIGCMPAVLDRLLTDGGLPTPYTFDSTKQAGAGWKGPYITGATVGQEVEEFTKDQWGNDYTYTPAAGPCPLTATLTSNGPDGKPGGGDDITVSIGAGETTGTAVRGRVKDSTGAGIEAVPVEFYAPVNGTLTTTTVTTDANGEYVFASVPFGPRGVRALPRLVFAPGSVTSAAGGRRVTFRVLNYSESSYTISQMRVDFDPVATDYDTIRLGGSVAESDANYTSGQVVNIVCPGGNPSCNVIAASPDTRPSFRVSVDSPDAQLPDVTVSGQGTSATIEVSDFNTSVSGTTMKVTFNPNGASSVVTLIVP